MTSTINATTTGGGGVVTTADASGNLALQGAGVTQITVTSTGVTLASALPVAQGGTGVTTSTGSGAVVLGTSPTITSPIIGITSFADYWQPAGGSATQATVSFKALGTDTNINVSLTPKGTGAVIAGPIPDGTATGGNARGANAIDLQTARTYQTQVASGSGSVVVGSASSAYGTNSIAAGYYAVASGTRAIAFNQSTASGTDSFSAGYGSVASANCSFAFGDRAMANGAYSFSLGQFPNSQSRLGSFTHASSPFTGSGGDAQHFFQILRIATSATTLARLTADAGAAGSVNIANLVNNSALRLTIDIVGRDTTTGDTGGWNIQAVMKRGANAAATALVGTPVVTVVGLDTAWVTQTSPSLTADTTNGGLNLSITPITANASRWVARILAVEVA